METFPIRRNTVLLAATLTCLSGMVQLVVAVSTVTLVLVTGIEGILGLGPAIFLAAGAVAAFPAGRAMDRYGRVPVLAVGRIAEAALVAPYVRHPSHGGAAEFRAGLLRFRAGGRL